MVRFEIDGRPIDIANFEDALLGAILPSVANELAERLRNVRDPESGEFPRVTVRIASEDLAMTIEVDGPPTLVERVTAILRDEPTSESMTVLDTETHRRTPSPCVFLSFGYEDRPLAEQIARELMAKGIDTWWSEWEIRAGESLRQKIDEGLGGCTHFVVLLTENSIEKPWVKKEIDAAFIQSVTNEVVLIPLRHGLDISRLPPLLRPLLSPEIRDFSKDLQQLVNDIHGVTRKPPLGPVPVRTGPAASGLSPGAEAIARLYVSESKNGTLFDPQLSVGTVAERTGLTRDDVEDAVDELAGLLWIHSTAGLVVANPAFYSKYDRLSKPWRPEFDARQIAIDMLNDTAFPAYTQAIAEHYGWEPRRLNPALAWLEEGGHVVLDKGLGDGTFIGFRMRPTKHLRRLLKSSTSSNACE